jgi:GntR family transcriptional regulator
MRQNTPQYRQVAQTLSNRIRLGQYRAGDVIPAAQELEAEFKVSNITIRKALGVLAAEGLVVGRPGIGTIVCDRPNDTRVSIEVTGNFRDWLDSSAATKLPVEQEILGIGSTPSPPEVARLLGIRAGVPVWCMRRLRRVESRPISYHVNFGLMETLGAIREKDMAGGRNFVDVVGKRCRVDLARMDQWVNAVVADLDLSRLLEIPFGDPLFFVQNAYYDPDGGIIAVTHLYLRADRYSYHVSIGLEGTG